MKNKIYIIDGKTYLNHINDEVHLYGLLHQLAFLAGRIKDEEAVFHVLDAAKRYGEIAEEKFQGWGIPGRYLVFGDPKDLKDLMAKELAEASPVPVEEPKPKKYKDEYIIPGYGFRMLVGDIHNLIVRNRKGCVIVVNKWDLVEKDNNTMKEWTEFLKKKLAPFNDIPIIFTSVLSKQRIFDVLQTAIRVYESRKRRISTSALNDFLLPLIENYPPPATKGKYIKIKYVTQLPTPTPQFAFFVNLPQYIKEPYRRFLENNIRDHWDFSGVPMQIYFRQK